MLIAKAGRQKPCLVFGITVRGEFEIGVERK
jgi:hypothetical protein